MKAERLNRHINHGPSWDGPDLPGIVRSAVWEENATTGEGCRSLPVSWGARRARVHGWVLVLARGGGAG